MRGAPQSGLARLMPGSADESPAGRSVSRRAARVSNARMIEIQHGANEPPSQAGRWSARSHLLNGFERHEIPVRHGSADNGLGHPAQKYKARIMLGTVARVSHPRSLEPESICGRLGYRAGESRLTMWPGGALYYCGTAITCEPRHLQRLARQWPLQLERFL